jgi:peptidoglycan/xylan/chitin deacetylase (PgdA/CDA1 family)
VIALYHRVAPEPNVLYTPLHPRNFDEHCAVLKRSFSVIPLSELIERHRTGRSLAGYCSITFDEGYRDFRDHALPILEAHGLPATQFVITDCLETGRAPWDLRLRRVVLCSGGNAHDESVLLSRLNGMSPEQREIWLANRERTIGETESRHALPEMLSPSDLPRLRAAGVEIGSHTVTHSILGEIDPALASRELAESKRQLDEWNGEVRVAAYPRGSFNRRTMSAARDAGYRAAVAVGNRAVTPRGDPFALPRFDVTDRPPGMLRMELGGVVEPIRRFRIALARGR